MNQMSCQQALQRLYEFLDGEITPETAEQIRRHVEICERCYPEVRFTSEFRDAVERAARGQPDCPEPLRDRIAALLDRETGGA